LKNRIFSIIPLLLFIIAIALMVLPTSAYLAFADAPEERVNPDDRIIVFYSYFSLNLFGFAKFAPPITACLSVVVALLHCVGFLAKKALRKATLVMSYVCSVLAIISVLSLLRYPLLPSFIALLLIGSTVLCTFEKRVL